MLWNLPNITFIQSFFSLFIQQISFEFLLCAKHCNRCHEGKIVCEEFLSLKDQILC